MSLKDIRTNFILTTEDFDRLKKYFSKVEGALYFDTETNSLQEKIAKIYGIGLYLKGKDTFYIPTRHPGSIEKDGDRYWNLTKEQEIFSWLNNEIRSRGIIGHNITYDCLVYEHDTGTKINTFVKADTLTLKHAIDENSNLGLKHLAVLELCVDADDSQQDLKDEVVANGGRWNKEHKDMFTGSIETLGKYCAMDVVLTAKLHNIYNAKIQEDQALNEIYENTELLPLIREVVVPMKSHGFRIDKPKFEKLKIDITKDISKLEAAILSEIAPEVEDFVNSMLDKEVPVKSTGNFPKVIANILGIPLPIASKKNKETGEIKESITLAAKAIEKQALLVPQYAEFYNWILGKNEYNFKDSVVRETQKQIFLNDGETSVFNIGSNDHLGHYFFKIKNYKPLSKTPKGKNKVDAKLLEHLEDKDPIANKLSEAKKLNKLLSTYVEGILEREVNSFIYTSMLLSGTSSGRFASQAPNLNNLPANKEKKSLVNDYTNEIRKGFIAGPGKKIVGCDFSSLEPHLAAFVSGDPGLIDIFVQGHDFYSAIGIKQFNITDATPAKDDSPDSFSVKYKSLRNLVKTYSLAAFYGATGPRISQVTGKTIKEADALLAGYFKAFPEVQKFINKTHLEAKKLGYVKTHFGRVRHLDRCKELYSMYSNQLLDWKWARANNLTEERSEFRNLLNNAVNFKIQGMAASCLNRSMLMMTREFKKRNLDARIILCIHDEVLVICDEDKAKEIAEIVKYSMENCVDISPIKLKATPIIGNSYGECK